MVIPSCVIQSMMGTPVLSRGGEYRHTSYTARPARDGLDGSSAGPSAFHISQSSHIIETKSEHAENSDRVNSKNNIV